MTGEKHAIRDCQNGVKLYYEKPATAAHPVHPRIRRRLAREPQVSHFSRRRLHRLFGTRLSGLDIPEEEASYSQDIARDDAPAVLDHLGIDNAHIVGLSMGGFATLHFGIAYADRALSLTICAWATAPSPHARRLSRCRCLSPVPRGGRGRLRRGIRHRAGPPDL